MKDLEGKCFVFGSTLMLLGSMGFSIWGIFWANNTFIKTFATILGVVQAISFACGFIWGICSIFEQNTN